jgi:hypothetical protein
MPDPPVAVQRVRSVLPSQSTMMWSDSPRLISLPSLRWFSLPRFHGEAGGDPKFLLLLLIHATLLHPGSASRFLPVSEPFVLASVWDETVAHCFLILSRLAALEPCGSSCGLHHSLCTLTLFHSIFLSSITPTLDTSEWLALTRQGLSPCKKHQAFLGAPSRNW